CREGNDWLVYILNRLEEKRGKDGDPDVLIDMASQIAGRSFCPLGDAAATPVLSSIKHFRSEYERRITNPPDDKLFIPIEAVGGH
ncbi:MAG TPA: NADH-ubiquinone oxidoreductase-F iron-sulfur binding region domain-containing protein, partial [Abditibacteriaceae bacterium]|nr:NADH-ubiquinone oxidoreductase-F iron-sulfur binding region domain-containing protein [Abditibacteriaceae bacterium]